jgi:hypothetical protein
MVAAIALVSICGCQPGRGPFAQIQVCLGSSGEVASFKQLLQAIAAEKNLTYIDGSVETTKGLKVIGTTGENMHTSGGLIHVGLEGENGALIAGNMGLNLYEVGIGFGHEPNPKGAEAFADFVTLRLKKHWSVTSVPPDRGMFPDPSCASVRD